MQGWAEIKPLDSLIDRAPGSMAREAAAFGGEAQELVHREMGEAGRRLGHIAQGGAGGHRCGARVMPGDDGMAAIG